MKNIDAEYKNIKSLYEKSYEIYLKRKIDICLLWIVENMYRIEYVYQYIKKNNNTKSKLFEKEIINISNLVSSLEKRIEYQYKKTNKKTKLECEINNIILRIEKIECMEEEIDIYKEKYEKEIRKIVISKEDEVKYSIIGKKISNYFIDNLKEENNYLPIDYLDMSRNKKFREKYETSPTNIAFQIIAIISSVDLEYINKEYALNILYKIIDTLAKMDKENGLLYNWYNIKTLEVTHNFISFVDNSNLLASLYVLNAYLNFSNDKLKKIIEEMNLNVFVDKKNNMVCIGIECGNKSINYYDRLMSEARLGIYIGIKRNQIEEKIWYKLKKEKMESGLFSWTGCAFEYFLPQIFMYSYKNTLLDDSLVNAYNQNIKYMLENDLEAFGMSACAYPRKTKENVYAYKEFGIPSIRLRIDKYEDYTITPHASILMSEINPKEVLNNIKRLENLNMNGRYGLYDSIDLDKRTKDKKGRYKVAKIYYTHNMGMMISSINNLLNNNIIKNRFKEGLFRVETLKNKEK